MITVDESGQNSIIVASGANMLLTPEDVAAAWENFNEVGVLVMPLEVPLPCIEEAARLGEASGAIVVLNPAPAQPLSDDLLGRVDVVAPNESETALLTDLPVETAEQAEQAARALQERGVESVVLTLGQRGVLLLDGEAPA